VRHSLGREPFAGRTGRGVTIAILDSGVHADHPHVGGVNGGTSFVLGDAPTDFIDRLGHGTAVAAAIREKSPGADLLIAKVFHRQLATSVDVLARAITWASDQGARLINLSLGTANPAHEALLAGAVLYAAERGTLVVSARESNGVAWLPGSLPGVAGVLANADIERDELEVARLSDAWPTFTASPYPRPIPNVPRERNLSGVSFAVANVTGFLARATEVSGGDPFAALADLK
jgi:subtilisin family serine protease